MGTRIIRLPPIMRLSLALCVVAAHLVIIATASPLEGEVKENFAGELFAPYDAAAAEGGDDVLFTEAYTRGPTHKRSSERHEKKAARKKKTAKRLAAKKKA